jgi:hypothetical protein
MINRAGKVNRLPVGLQSGKEQTLNLDRTAREAYVLSVGVSQAPGVSKGGSPSKSSPPKSCSQSAR